MKKLNLLLALSLMLFTAQWASAQCTGTISATGSGATYTFTSTNPVAATAMHSWDFGDGTYGISATATHTYATTGNYQVIGIYGDSANMCADYDTIMIYAVAPVSCNAAFSVAGNSPSFTFTPTGTPTAPPGYYSYSWDFGDGSTGYSTGAQPHTYTANGTYNVTCILYDSIWCSDTVTNSVVVTGIGTQNCDATFTYADSNGVYYFFSSFPTPSLSYTWTLSNGAVFSGPNPVVNINQAGTYTMCLDIIDSLTLCSDTYCSTFTVTTGGGVTCDATFSYSNQGLVYSFAPNTPNASANYFWDFGDGNTSTATAPTHVYAAGGTYTVSCGMSVPGMCADSSISTITVGPIPTSGTISGVVSMASTYADEGVVFLISHDSNGILSLIDTTTIDSFGMYYFSNVNYGTYLVKAALSPASSNFANFLPSYHASTPAGSTGVLLWSAASDVVLNTPYINNIDIDLVIGLNSGGPGFIGGLVSQGANKTGDPISDVNIMVLDANGDAVAYTYSDHTGSFQVDDLAYGTYTVYPEVQGRTTTPIDIVISASDLGTNDVRVVVNKTTIETSVLTSVGPELNAANITVYPSPVNDVLNVDLGSEVSGIVEISILDVTGKVLQSSVVNSQSKTQLNTTQLSEGLYILSIQNNGTVSNIKFVK